MATNYATLGDPEKDAALREGARALASEYGNAVESLHRAWGDVAAIPRKRALLLRACPPKTKPKNEREQEYIEAVALVRGFYSKQRCALKVRHRTAAGLSPDGRGTIQPGGGVPPAAVQELTECLRKVYTAPYSKDSPEGEREAQRAEQRAEQDARAFTHWRTELQDRRALYRLLDCPVLVIAKEVKKFLEVFDT